MEKFELRPLKERDLNDFVRLCEDERVSEMTGRTVPAEEAFRFSMDDARAYAFTLDGVFCGYASLFGSSITDVPGGHRAFEAAFALVPEHWGKGYGKRMLALLLEEAEKECADCVLAGAFEDNERSGRLLRSSGFIRIFDRKDSGRTENIYLKVL